MGSCAHFGQMHQSTLDKSTLHFLRLQGRGLRREGRVGRGVGEYPVCHGTRGWWQGSGTSIPYSRVFTKLRSQRLPIRFT